jgi:hypothetical protein|tara:strand:- start:1104 stop:1739 length:636 start_codon:yes stop_codon:yes gene_type:complete
VKKEASFNNLYKKIDATSKTRFHSSRRLKQHSKWSTYIVVLISLGLILISLMQAYGLGNNIKSSLVGLIQAFSAIAVLVYSLLIDKNDYSSLSEKMYSCAAQLGELKQKVHPHLDNDYDEKIYGEYRDEYNSILKLFETHSMNDFRGDYFRAKLEMPENYVIENLNWWTLKLKIYVAYSINFVSYPTVLLILSWVLYWLWFGVAPEPCTDS